MSIVVIGSFMMDLVVRTKRAPGAGETIIGNSFGRFPGGKGANQAAAAARLGGRVAMIGKLGKDPFGDDFRDVLRQEGIDDTHVRTDERHATGIGSIVVEESGENRIIVVPGANLHYTVEELAEVEAVVQNAQVVVMQLEMDIATIESAAQMAKRHGVPLILNPAPAQPLSDELLAATTILTPNETELELLTGVKVATIEDAENAAKQLLAKGVGQVVVTLAAKGALIVGADGSRHVPGFRVTPVDTVAAGDSFNGALAVQLTEGKSLAEAARFANAVGALTVTRQGAIPSLPHRNEVESFMKGEQ
ncbi:ribokinase [Paenibacillus cymbidii]|uniref:ribokinase n=1 Tax=Paenibacillus cymbidii TaxID=1639034 RepID=UPI0010801296|nr:ribokinase [Paenibacillus cymbidii]